MPVTLKIISYQRLTPGQDAQFRPDAKRFSIGRGQENHWTLPDPQRFMSGTHCWLEERDGAWYLTDTSTNGTYINGSDKRVDKNDSVALHNGDRIRLGDYEFAVSVDDQLGAAAVPASATRLEDEEDIFASPKAAEPPREREGRKEANTPLSQLDDGLLGGGVSIDELYGLAEDHEEQQEPPSLARGDDRGSPMQQHFSAPRVEQKADDVLPDEYAANLDEIPDNWDEDTDAVETPEVTDAAITPAPPLAEVVPRRPVAPDPADVSPDLQDSVQPDRSPDRPPDRPSTRPATGAPPEAARRSSPDAQTALAAFAEGCGLDPRQLQGQDEAVFFQSVGELLRTMTEGLMQAIASRGQIKSEFRLEQTMIGPTRNNPFKFSVSPQETLLRLFGPTDSAYLAGPAAAAEAIDDINAHQMAVLAGTEAALKSVLRRFKPSALEARFGEDSALAKAVPTIRKARYWEFFKALYDEVSEATDDDFQKFFGSEFSNAYEQQLERLKISRKEPTK
jgi:type VI secretion system protein